MLSVKAAAFTVNVSTLGAEFNPFPYVDNPSIVPKNGGAVSRGTTQASLFTAVVANTIIPGLLIAEIVGDDSVIVLVPPFTLVTVVPVAIDPVYCANSPLVMPATDVNCIVELLTGTVAVIVYPNTPTHELSLVVSYSP